MLPYNLRQPTALPKNKCGWAYHAEQQGMSRPFHFSMLSNSFQLFVLRFVCRSIYSFGQTIQSCKFYFLLV